MKIQKLLVANDWVSSNFIRGTHNGYIGLPPEHPWHGKHYDDIPCDCHGGLTFSNRNERFDKLANIPRHSVWWIGFDTLHLYDTSENCNEQYVRTQVDSMEAQALAYAEGQQGDGI